MIMFLISATTYVGLLVFIKPAPSSLKTVPITYIENLKLVRGSICSGVFILFIFLLTTNFGFISVDENLYRTLALSNNSDQLLRWPAQSVSHLFIHSNLIHLAANAIGLGLASIYERRVGAKRYLAVLFVGSAASMPSILFYSENVAVSGISGGVFGLAAAYFTDEKELSTKEWLAAISLFVFLAILLAIEGEFKGRSSAAADLRIDHIGHFLGALGAIIYCRLKPQRLTSQSTRTQKNCADV